MDKRVLSLIVLAHASDVLENAFGPLSDQASIFVCKCIVSFSITNWPWSVLEHCSNLISKPNPKRNLILVTASCGQSLRPSINEYSKWQQQRVSFTSYLVKLVGVLLSLNLYIYDLRRQPLSILLDWLDNLDYMSINPILYAFTIIIPPSWILPIKF